MTPMNRADDDDEDDENSDDDGNIDTDVDRSIEYACVSTIFYCVTVAFCSV